MSVVHHGHHLHVHHVNNLPICAPRRCLHSGKPKIIISWGASCLCEGKSVSDSRILNWIIVREMFWRTLCWQAHLHQHTGGVSNYAQITSQNAKQRQACLWDSCMEHLISSNNPYPLRWTLVIAIRRDRMSSRKLDCKYLNANLTFTMIWLNYHALTR